MHLPSLQYRARQKRIAANLGTNRHNRARLLREVEAALLRCKDLFPEDGRPYVSLGKLYVQQRRYDEALAIYEEGCTATGERQGPA
jgi:tetratricopeptide (TPR) repeat protein